MCITLFLMTSYDRLEFSMLERDHILNGVTLSLVQNFNPLRSISHESFAQKPFETC